MPRGFEDHCWKDIVPTHILNIYKAYERELYVGERPALLSIDNYNVVYRGGPNLVEDLIGEHPSTCGIHAWEALPHTERLFKAARAVGIPIIYTTTETRKEANVTKAYATARQRMVVDNDAFEIKQELAPEPGDLVIYKQRASGFYGTPLLAQLHQLGVDSLIVCGESTSGCVRASVVDAFSNGIHTTIAEECVFDRSELSHKVNLFDLHHKYADVMTVDEIAQHLYAGAGLKEAV